MPRQQSFDAAISIRPQCRARYQIARVLGEDFCPSSVFDWQITPRRSFLAYLRNDFRGMFELADLRAEGNRVKNIRHDTAHYHEFPKNVAQEEIAAHYADARSRHDHLAAKTRALFAGDRRVLLCLSRHRSWWKMAHFNLAIRRHYPRFRFTILNGPANDISHGGESWKGNEAVWSRHLAPFVPASFVPRA